MSAADYGRKVKFEWDGNEIPGIREKGLTVNGEAANVTADEDDGKQYLLEEDAEASIELSLSGVSKDHTLLVAKLNGNIRGTATVTWQNGAVLEFEANIGPVTEGMPYNEARTFETTLMSSGDWTYTPPIGG